MELCFQIHVNQLIGFSIQLNVSFHMEHHAMLTQEILITMQI